MPGSSVTWDGARAIRAGAMASRRSPPTNRQRSLPTQSASALIAAEVFADLRPLLFSIAYRMLASVASSDDILQEAYLRFDRACRAADAGEAAPIESPRAFLSAVVTRLAIDEIRSAR